MSHTEFSSTPPAGTVASSPGGAPAPANTKEDAGGAASGAMANRRTGAVRTSRFCGLLRSLSVGAQAFMARKAFDAGMRCVSAGRNKAALERLKTAFDHYNKAALRLDDAADRRTQQRCWDLDGHAGEAALKIRELGGEEYYAAAAIGKFVSAGKEALLLDRKEALLLDRLGREKLQERALPYFSAAAAVAVENEKADGLLASCRAVAEGMEAEQPQIAAWIYELAASALKDESVGNKDCALVVAKLYEGAASLTIRRLSGELYNKALTYASKAGDRRYYSELEGKIQVWSLESGTSAPPSDAKSAGAKLQTGNDAGPAAEHGPVAEQPGARAAPPKPAAGGAGAEQAIGAVPPKVPEPILSRLLNPGFEKAFSENTSYGRMMLGVRRALVPFDEKLKKEKALTTDEIAILDAQVKSLRVFGQTLRYGHPFKKDCQILAAELERLRGRWAEGPGDVQKSVESARPASTAGPDAQ